MDASYPSLDRHALCARLREALQPEDDDQRDAITWLLVVLGCDPTPRDHGGVILRMIVRSVDRAYDRGAAQTSSE
jgi:hypothetical protein